MTSPSVVLKVKRSEAVAVQPARPTPIEVKSLSDWDNQAILQCLVPVILFYKHSELATDKDPADTIKRALAEALVYYYPWAGRLKDGPDGTLMVDCTAEGVVFVEADANVSLDQLSLQPPFPWADEFLYSKHPVVVDATPPLGSPLFGMQVTRLLCGGFVLAFTFNHIISDGIGAAMFLTAIAEIAGGADAPSVLPVWQRDEVLKARDPPHAPHNNTTSKAALPFPIESIVDNGIHGTFFFGPREIATIRAHIPERLRESCTSFELIVACVLHCRVTTLQHAPDEQVQVAFEVDCRKRFVDRPVPAGYYGNVNFHAGFVCPMQDLHNLGCAVEKVQKAKEEMNQDYAQSILDNEVIRRRSPAPYHAHARTVYHFNDWSRIGFSTLDFQPWGKPIFLARPYDKLIHIANFMVAFTNEKDEEGRLLNLYMSKDAVDKFSITLSQLLEFN